MFSRNPLHKSHPFGLIRDMTYLSCSRSVRSSSDGIKTVIVLVLHRQQHNRQMLRALRRESENQCRILWVTYHVIIKWWNSLNYTSFC